MAQQDEKQRHRSIDVKTLVIAAAAAVTAAVVTSFFWKKGTLISTALTPVIVALTQEALRKAPEKIGVTASRATASPVRGAGALAAAGAVREASASRAHETPPAPTRRAPLSASTPAAGRFDERRLLERERGLGGDGPAGYRNGTDSPGVNGADVPGRNGTDSPGANGAHPRGSNGRTGTTSARGAEGLVAPPPPFDDTRSYHPARSAGAGEADVPGDTAPAVAAGSTPERRVYGRKRFRWKVAIVTGLVAFGIAAVALTASELALGGSVGGDGRTSLFGGNGGAERLGGDGDSSDGGSGSDSSPSGSSESQSVPGGDGGAAPAPEAPAPEEPAPTEEPAEPAPAEPAPVQPAPAE